MVSFAAAAPAWKIQQSRLLSQPEIDAVIADLRECCRHTDQALIKLVIFRLATFCGLRVSEICGLNLGDLKLEVNYPAIRIRGEIAKGGKAREVGILSAATLADLRQWMALRIKMGAGAADPFCCSISCDSLGNRFNRQGARKRFQAACSVLGRERADGLTIHTGRHVAASQALHKGVPLAVVRDMLGHSSIAVTNVYVGVFRDGKGVGYSLD